MFGRPDVKASTGRVWLPGRSLTHTSNHFSFRSGRRRAKKKTPAGAGVSPLVDEDELAVDGVPGHVFGGLHPDVGQTGLGDDVGVQAADGHQAAQVAALVVGLVVLVQPHFGGRPALQVARAVDGAEALAVGCQERRTETGGGVGRL